MQLNGNRDEARRNTRARFEQWARNPTCTANTISAVHNVRMDTAAVSAGITPSFGQSPFAIARGNRFEAGLFDDDAIRLRSALERCHTLPPGSEGFLDFRLRLNGGSKVLSVQQALDETSDWLNDIALGGSANQSIVAAPMIKIPKGVLLPEALLVIDVVAVIAPDDAIPRLTVGEIKVFPDRGGYTDPQQLSSARAQAGIYRHALQLATEAMGLADRIDISEHGFLVFTWPGSNSPSIRANENLEYQSIRAERGFHRMEEVAQTIIREDDFAADDPALITRVLDAPTDYQESCLTFCDLGPRCHAVAGAADDAVILGDEVKRLLGDMPLTRALELRNGSNPQDEREAEIQRLIMR